MRSMIPFRRNQPGKANPKFNHLLNTRLPDCPAPECLNCHASLKEVRPFHVEPVSAGAFRFSCLSKCTLCQAPHIGFRSIGIKDGRTRFLLQEFELYSVSKHGQDLARVAEQIHKKREKLDEIQSRPVLEPVQ